jgi:hypothetical protein
MGAGDYETSKGLYNKLLGLPKEDFDECASMSIPRGRWKGQRSSLVHISFCIISRLCSVVLK